MADTSFPASKRFSDLQIIPQALSTSTTKSANQFGTDNSAFPSTARVGIIKRRLYINHLSAEMSKDLTMQSHPQFIKFDNPALFATKLMHSHHADFKTARVRCSRALTPRTRELPFRLS